MCKNCSKFPDNLAAINCQIKRFIACRKYKKMNFIG